MKTLYPKTKQEVIGPPVP